MKPYALLTYDFPHRKTQDLLFRFVATFELPAVVIGAPRRDLHLPPHVRTSVRHIDALHPRLLCETFDIPYVVSPHDEVAHLPGIDYALIGGARVLPASTIEQFPGGVLNLHPGVLPRTRGLDCIPWAILDGVPFGVTAHIVDARVDVGRIVMVREIEEYPDDTLMDIDARVCETQTVIAAEAMQAFMAKPAQAFPLAEPPGPYRSVMPLALQAELPEALEKRHAAL